MSPAIPQLPDSTLAFLREGYTFVSSRCDRLGTDAFRTRLMLRPVVCLRGAEAAALLYDPERFGRQGAVPRSAMHLLQDEGSVQSLTGQAHHHRKRLFLDVLGADSVQRLADLFATGLAGLLERAAHERIVFDREVRVVLTEAALRWAGLDAPGATVRQRAEEFGLMVDQAGSFGPPNWYARARRRDTERWATAQVIRLRDEAVPADAGPAAALATHRDEQGRLLPAEVAAVELLNLLRPIVATGRFMTFAAVALVQHPHWRDRLAAGAVENGGGTGEARASADAVLFAQEVRRYYPFFPVIGGTALHAFEWQGIRFEAGDWALLDLYGTDHDPRVWTDPESFDPERFRDWVPNPNTLVPQGGGDVSTGHRCPGEEATISLVRAAAHLLAARPELAASAQDLTYDLRRMPAVPHSGVVLGPA